MMGGEAQGDGGQAKLPAEERRGWTLYLVSAGCKCLRANLFNGLSRPVTLEAVASSPVARAIDYPGGEGGGSTRISRRAVHRQLGHKSQRAGKGSVAAEALGAPPRVDDGNS